MPRKIEKRNRESQFKYLFCLIVLINIQSCKTYKITSANQNTPIKDFDIELVGDAPEYAKIEYWAEHTDKENQIIKLRIA